MIEGFAGTRRLAAEARGAFFLLATVVGLGTTGESLTVFTWFGAKEPAPREEEEASRLGRPQT